MNKIDFISFEVKDEMEWEDIGEEECCEVSNGTVEELNDVGNIHSNGGDDFTVSLTADGVVVASKQNKGSVGDAASIKCMSGAVSSPSVLPVNGKHVDDKVSGCIRLCLKNV